MKFLKTCLLSFVLLLSLGIAQAKAGTKIAECRYGQKEVPTVISDDCSLYWVQLCKQVWNGDHLRTEEAFPDQKYELRCANNKTLLKTNKDDLIKWYFLGGDVVAFLLKGKGYILVNLKTGKNVQTDFDALAVSAFDESPAPTNALLWHGSAADMDAGKIVPSYRVTSVGGIGEALPGSDMRRMAYLERGLYCDGAAFNAAVMAEKFSYKTWSELQRVSLNNNIDIAPAGNIDANCEKFKNHLFVAQRRTDGFWQLMSAQEGTLFEPQISYPTAEKAKTEMATVFQRLTQANENVRLVEAQEKIKKEALDIKRAEAAMQAEANLEATYNVVRLKIKQLQMKGEYEAAARLAQENLPSYDWGLAVLLWRDASIEVLQNVVRANLVDKNSPHLLGSLIPLGEKLEALRFCEKIKPSQAELNGDFSRSEYFGPKKKTWLEMDMAKQNAFYTLKPTRDQKVVYDYATDQWSLSSDRNSPDYLNMPNAQGDALVRISMGKARVEVYQQCMTRARAIK